MAPAITVKLVAFTSSTPLPFPSIILPPAFRVIFVAENTPAPPFIFPESEIKLMVVPEASKLFAPRVISPIARITPVPGPPPIVVDARVDIVADVALVVTPSVPTVIVPDEFIFCNSP